ncbi:MAG: macro domain-containing protein [Fibrobacter sp.]|nr:macro domain-containing protein [Fibrobacter sp.]
MSLKIVRNDITKVKADAIVNSANKNPICGGGAEYSIYEAAGHAELLAAREKVGELKVAEIAATPAFALNAKFIIHTVGPKWNGGVSGETIALANCYRGALEKAKELGCNSIAFPLISSGVFRFPKDSALKIALQTIGEFLESNEMDVQLVVFDRKSFEVSEDLYSDIHAYIDDNYVSNRYEDVRTYTSEHRIREWKRNWQNENTEKFNVASFDFTEYASPEAEEICKPLACSRPAPITKPRSENIEDILKNTGETFCSKLFALIHEKKQDDVEIYKKANIDRKHFSKIRSNVNYKPTKKTALALAIALQLDLDETKDLLARAELALSPSNKGDLIVKYFIEQKKYDIWEINTMLFKFGQPTLGA